MYKKAKYFIHLHLERYDSFLCVLEYYIKMIFESDKGKSFSKEQAIDLMVSLSATDANSEKKWRGFYNSLSQSELRNEWDEHWQT